MRRRGERQTGVASQSRSRRTAASVVQIRAAPLTSTVTSRSPSGLQACATGVRSALASAAVRVIQESYNGQLGTGSLGVFDKPLQVLGL